MKVKTQNATNYIFSSVGLLLYYFLCLTRAILHGFKFGYFFFHVCLNYSKNAVKIALVFLACGIFTDSLHPIAATGGGVCLSKSIAASKFLVSIHKSYVE